MSDLTKESKLTTPTSPPPQQTPTETIIPTVTQTQSTSIVSPPRPPQPLALPTNTVPATQPPPPVQSSVPSSGAPSTGGFLSMQPKPKTSNSNLKPSAVKFEHFDENMEKTQVSNKRLNPAPNNSLKVSKTGGEKDTLPKPTDFNSDDEYDHEPPEETILKPTWTTYTMVNYTRRSISVIPQCTWKLVEPNNWNDFLWTSNDQLMKLEKQIARNAVKIHVTRLISKGLVPGTVEYVCILDACFHYNPSTPAEGYHWTLCYSCEGQSLTANEDYPSKLMLVHVPMTWDNYWNTLSDMIDGLGLGTSDKMSLKSILKAFKSKSKDETKK